jgi:hypothetical protein
MGRHEREVSPAVRGSSTARSNLETMLVSVGLVKLTISISPLT